MARERGRGVVLELMNAVERLEATTARHAEQMEEVARLGLQTAATTEGNTSRFDDIEQRLTRLERKAG